MGGRQRRRSGALGKVKTRAGRAVHELALPPFFQVEPACGPIERALDQTPGKVTPGGKKKRKKAMGGGMMDMTRMRYLKGGQV